MFFVNSPFQISLKFAAVVQPCPVQIEEEKRRLEAQRVQEKVALQMKLLEEQQKLESIREKKRQLQMLEEQKRMEKELEMVFFLRCAWEYLAVFLIHYNARRQLEVCYIPREDTS